MKRNEMFETCGRRCSRFAIEDDVFDAFGNAAFKSIAQPPRVFVTIEHLLLCQFRRRAKAHDVRDWFGARASLALLMTADVLGEQAHAASHE